MKQFKGSIILLITAIIWGTAFVSQKVGMDYIGPFTFGASRFLLGAVVLIPLILVSDWFDRSRRESLKENCPQPAYRMQDLLGGGILCGAALFFGASFQQYGIVYTTAGKAGFITALYIVLVPLLGLMAGRKGKLNTWIGVAMAAAGLYLLTINEGFSMQSGDFIVLIGTIFWALHIIAVDAYAGRADGLKLSFVQFATAGMFSAISAGVFENPDIKSIEACSGPILFSAVFVVGIAYTLQIVGQKYTKPTVAAIILSMESFFAAVSGAALLGEVMSAKEKAGCVLMLAAVVVTQVKAGGNAGPCSETGQNA